VNEETEQPDAATVEGNSIDGIASAEAEANDDGMPYEINELIYVKEGNSKTHHMASVLGRAKSEGAETMVRVKYDSRKGEYVIPLSSILGSVKDTSSTKRKRNLPIIDDSDFESSDDDSEPNDDSEPDNIIEWKFIRIASHRFVNRNYKLHDGCCCNVRVDWENGETTEQPVNHMIEEAGIFMAKYAFENGLLDTTPWKKCKAILIKADPMTAAQYALDNDLLHKPGWKKCKAIVEQEGLTKS
jgi:hypothetical protein